MASRAQQHIRVRETSSFGKRMSTHIAYALVVYTLLLIFEVSPQMESNGMSILPYFLLVLLVGVMIVPCRNLERRWKAIDASGNTDVSGLFRRDAILLWLGAIGFPTLMMLTLWIIP
jgi:isoprenylcysteine carboxyl methyltransferase (ICMT) family protein YpbQ